MKLANLILLVLTLSAFGCSLMGYETNEVKTMPVDSLIVPAEVTAGQAFSVRIVGLLTNGCQRFERLAVNRTPNKVEIRMLARELVRYHAACTDDIRWVSQDYSVNPPFADSMLIVAHQRDGSIASKLVRAK